MKKQIVAFAVVCAVVFGVFAVFAQDPAGGSTRPDRAPKIYYQRTSPSFAPEGSFWLKPVGTNTAATNYTVMTPAGTTAVYTATGPFGQTGLVVYVQIGYFGSNALTATNVTRWLPLLTISNNVTSVIP